jgi:surface antigen
MDWGICMSSSDDRQRSFSNELQLPGLVSQLSPAEQVPFPKNTPLPGKRTRYLEYDSSPGISGPLTETGSSPDTTGSLPENITPPNVTRVLPDMHTGTLPSSSTRSTTTALRQPVVIRGTHTKSPRTIRPPKGRKRVISIAVISLLFLITLGTAFAVSPLGNVTGHGTNLIPFVNNLVHNNNSNLSLVMQQATATAVIRQDGYDPTSSGGAITLTGGGSLNRFAFGQCTYWANYRYHQLTGYWVDWLGNAYQWEAGAKAAGWIVSSKPNLKGPSIIVLQPGVEGAGYYGHVAVVEKVNSNGSVYTSNFNWYANGGWDILSYWTFTPGPGVSFAWHP